MTSFHQDYAPCQAPLPEAEIPELTGDLVVAEGGGEKCDVLLVGFFDDVFGGQGVFGDDNGSDVAEGGNGNDVDVGLEGDPEVAGFGSGHNAGEQVRGIAAGGDGVLKVLGSGEEF